MRLWSNYCCLKPFLRKSSKFVKGKLIFLKIYFQILGIVMREGDEG
jgi:hypothetical protein